MFKRRLIVLILLWLAGGALFLLANRAAYRCFFRPEDYVTMGRVAVTPALELAQELASLEVSAANPRPLGELFYLALDAAAGDKFPWWILAVHVLHLLLTGGVCILLLQLGIAPVGACAGALLFLYHSAVLPIYWRPAGVYDLLCGVFCLLSILAYIRGRVLLSLLSFFLALKSKEVALMLPFVLAAYESRFGAKDWRRLVLFFILAFWMGLQAVIVWEEKSEEYSLAVGPQSVAHTAYYYLRHLFKTPVLALVVLLIPGRWRDPRLRFGAVAMILLLVPMLLLPERMSGAFWYVPLIGFCIAAGALAEHRKPQHLALFFLVWWTWGYAQLRPFRSREFLAAAESREYFTALSAHARGNPADRRFVFEALPANFNVPAVEGALRYLYRNGEVSCGALDLAKAPPEYWKTPVVLLGWDLADKKLFVLTRDPDQPYPDYIVLDGSAPVWSLTRGWLEPQPKFRWTLASATAMLHQPAEARWFEITLNVGPDQFREKGGAGVKVFLDGTLLGEADFRETGWKTARWELQRRKAGTVEVRLETPERYQMPRGKLTPLGAAVMKFGFMAD